MSLINDALKRAKEQSAPTPAHINPPPLQPVEYVRHSNTGAVYVSMALLVVIVGVWLLAKGWDTTRRAAASVSPQPVGARELPATSQKPTPAASEATPVQASISGFAVFEPTSYSPSSVARDFSVETAVAVAAAPPAAVQASSASSFKLQAIFYRSANPSAVINGRTLSLGGKIDDAKVLAITRDTVTLQTKNETKVLTLY